MVVNKDFQQTVNKALVLRSVLAEHGITRAALSRKLGMYRSTVSNLTEHLLMEGWLRELGTDSKAPGVGRKGTCLAINEKKGVVAGIDIKRKGRYEIVLLSPLGERLGQTQGRAHYPQSFSSLLHHILQHAQKEVAPMKRPILGMGIAVVGPVDRERQSIVTSPHYADADGFALSSIQPSYDFPLFIENDTHCCAHGKAWQDPLADDFAYLYLNSPTTHTRHLAFGLSFRINGKPYHGAHHLAGEFPRMFTRRLERDFRDQIAEILADPAESHSRFAVSLNHAADDFLNMVQFFDPRTLFLGHHLERFQPEIESYLASRSSEISFAVDFAGVGPDEAAYGAACLSLEQVYAVPNPGA
ncbi:MAG: ROK family protein [Spirochaetales bacterium]|nr:ROK family protein [Spirochaetales bacterium]